MAEILRYLVSKPLFLPFCCFNGLVLEQTLMWFSSYTVTVVVDFVCFCVLLVHSCSKFISRLTLVLPLPADISKWLVISSAKMGICVPCPFTR